MRPAAHPASVHRACALHVMRAGRILEPLMRAWRESIVRKKALLKKASRALFSREAGRAMRKWRW
eukprot:6956315-Prymnesium_polylepis.2